MPKHNFGNYQVELDMDATEKWYATSEGWRCECRYCRNFLRLAKTKELPLHIMQILDELDISPEKATYVCKLYDDDRGIHYQFSYRIAGTIIDVPGKDKTVNWDEAHCSHEPYTYGAPNFPKPHFDLEFFAILPWVLDEPQNG